MNIKQQYDWQPNFTRMTVEEYDKVMSKKR
jgi:hypothetical protein